MKEFLVFVAFIGVILSILLGIFNPGFFILTFVFIGLIGLAI